MAKHKHNTVARSEDETLWHIMQQVMELFEAEPEFPPSALQQVCDLCASAPVVPLHPASETLRMFQFVCNACLTGDAWRIKSLTVPWKLGSEGLLKDTKFTHTLRVNGVEV